jgi:DnaJ-class molecular chaperone
LREVEAKLKKSKNKSHYELLDIDPASSPGEIKKQYKKMALKWHPDKNTESVEMRNFAEVQFKVKVVFKSQNSYGK